VTTQLTFAGLQVTENQAGFAGAGLYVGASSQVTLDGGGSCEGGLVVCPSNVWFNQLTGTGQDGAAAYVANNAKLRLYQTSVGRNAVPDPLPDGSILHVAGAGAELFTESVEVWNNTGAGSVFEAEAGGALRIAFTTAALNRYGTGEGVANSLGVKVAGTDSIGRINTSIFHPTGAFLASGGGSFSQVDCLITSTTAGLPGSVTIYVDDPEYVDLAGGDLRVGIHSPAVDFCDAIYYAPAHDDMLGEDRFHDVVANPNGNPGVNGAFDAGAFEFQDIFSDGFETGNTNNWDVRVPPGP
jgi:hypothetical protein